MGAFSPLRRFVKAEIHSSAIFSGEGSDGESEDGVLRESGKDAVGRSREPGKTVFDGGKWSASIAILTRTLG